jgi:hypothetical protein
MVNKKHPPDTVDHIREFFLTHTFSFDQIVQMSQEIFGFQITKDELLQMSRREGGWEIMRKLSSPEKKFEDISERMYLIAMNKNDDGSEAKIAPSVSVRAAQVYMDVQAKIGALGSARRMGTAPSEINRLMREAEEELKEFDSSIPS